MQILYDLLHRVMCSRRWRYTTRYQYSAIGKELAEWVFSSLVFQRKKVELL